MTVSVILFVVAGAVIIAISIPLLRRRIPPNALYGLRVPATFADEWVWYEANARSARDLIAVGGVVVVVALLLPAVPGVSERAFSSALTTLLLVGVVGAAVVGWRRANRLLRERRAGEGGTPGKPPRN